MCQFEEKIVVAILAVNGKNKHSAVFKLKSRIFEVVDRCLVKQVFNIL